MTIGDMFKGAAYRWLEIKLQANKPTIQAIVHTNLTGVLVESANVIATEFPRDNMEERMADGPFEIVIKKSAPLIAVILNKYFDKGFDATVKWLDDNAKLRGI